MSELNNKERVTIPAHKFVDLILDIGTFMLSSGAHCGRLNSNLNRLAETWGFEIDINPTFRGLFVSARDKNNVENTITSYREAPTHNVHLAILTEVSHLSWQTKDHSLSIEEVEKEFARIKAIPSYKNWQIAIAVGFSCAGLCILSGGCIQNALMALVAASIGFTIKAKISSMKFNPMIPITVAAFVTTLITGLGNIYQVGTHPQTAMATAVLYLIPGVPLINCVIDLIESYLTSSANRALFSGLTLLCIAAGMTLCITMLGISNFD